MHREYDLILTLTVQITIGIKSQWYTNGHRQIRIGVQYGLRRI